MVFQGFYRSRSKAGRSAKYSPAHNSLNERGPHWFRRKGQNSGGSLKAYVGEKGATHFLTKSGDVKGMKCSKMMMWILAGIIG